MCHPGKFVFVGDGQHGVEKGKTIQQNGLGYAFVTWQWGGGATESERSEFVNDVECLLRLLMNISDLLIEAVFIV